LRIVARHVCRRGVSSAAPSGAGAISSAGGRGRRTGRGAGRIFERLRIKHLWRDSKVAATGGRRHAPSGRRAQCAAAHRSRRQSRIPDSVAGSADRLPEPSRSATVEIVSQLMENLEQFVVDVIEGRRSGTRAGVAKIFLLILSLPFKVVVQFRLWLYRKRLKRETSLGCLVISVGNLTAGG